MNFGLWENYVTDNGDCHVMPVDDLKPHCLDTDCWCRPEELESEGCIIFSHSAMDDRESYERGRKLH